MASPFKKLASETAIYGLSTILARIINFLFVPFYTRMLTTGSYGVVTEFMAYIAVLQVMLVMGLETGCFRFANKKGVDANKVYTNALSAVSALSLAFMAIMVVFSGQISSALGYAGFKNVILYVAGILVLDSITAILFARLRQEHKAFKFALFKTIKILTETGANLLLFFWFPSYCIKHSNTWLLNFVGAQPDFDYVIFAIFISCIACSLLFLPMLFRQKYTFDHALLKQMLIYSTPLMVAALPGILNDFLDRILFRFLDTNSEMWQSSLGVFQAAVKLSVIMNLFIQMFRFAAEPFFFQRAADKDSKFLYAKVMEYFTAFCAVVFLGVVLYIDVISLLLGRDFRSAVEVVPIMLLSYMVLGMLFNVSMWYKLSGKTNVAIWITLAGLLVTIGINVTFMPRFSYWASAFGHLASYLVMFIISALLGAKHYPIPYRWSRIAILVGVMLSFTVGVYLLDKSLLNELSLWIKLAIHTVVIIIYMIAAKRVVR
jgi:O-antigen/teichoic acid export membrane protein